MKTELRLASHSGVPDAKVIEVWYGGVFIGQVTGADGAGIRFMSKYPRRIIEEDSLLVEIRIKVNPPRGL